VGLFYKNNLAHFINTYGYSRLATFSHWILLSCSGLVMLSLEFDSLANGDGIFYVPLYMAALAIGLFFTHSLINSKPVG
jgi:hypothetical protein